MYKYLPPQSNIVVAVKVLRLCGTTEKQRAWFNREILQGIENAHVRYADMRPSFNIAKLCHSASPASTSDVLPLRGGFCASDALLPSG